MSESGLLNNVLNRVKTVYSDLCCDELLMKCLHGKTQNANECFNGLTWQRAIKEVYVSLPTITFALYDAAAHFNNGGVSTLDILRQADIEPGYYTTKACIARDHQCMQNPKRKSADGTEQAAKKRRAAIRTKGEHNAS